MRKTLLITSTIIVILGLAAGAYFYFTTKAPSLSVAPSSSGGLPVAGQGTSPTSSSGSDSTGDGGSNPDSIGAPTKVSSQLVQISVGPVVPGEIVLDTPNLNVSSTTNVLVEFIERQSGNVFSYAPISQTLTRINNKTLPGIQSATWLTDGSAALVQYLSGNDFSTINTYSLAATTTDGFFLPQDLAGVATSPTKILSSASGVNGSVVSLSNLDGANTATVFTTPLSSLRVAFAGKNQYLAFPKPSGALSGDAFLVNAQGYFSRIAGPLNGLVALPSPSGKWALVSYTQAGKTALELVDTTANTTLQLPVATIADKCVWTTDDTTIYCGVPVNQDPSYLYPDDWYQGAVHFSDKIWKIDVSGRYAQLVLDFPSLGKGDLDATALSIDPLNTTLVFINKNDSSLWSYSL